MGVLGVHHFQHCPRHSARARHTEPLLRIQILLIKRENHGVTFDEHLVGAVVLQQFGDGPEEALGKVACRVQPACEQLTRHRRRAAYISFHDGVVDVLRLFSGTGKCLFGGEHLVEGSCRPERFDLLRVCPDRNPVEHAVREPEVLQVQPVAAVVGEQCERQFFRVVVALLFRRFGKFLEEFQQLLGTLLTLVDLAQELLFVTTRRIGRRILDVQQLAHANAPALAHEPAGRHAAQPAFSTQGPAHRLAHLVELLQITPQRPPLTVAVCFPDAVRHLIVRRLIEQHFEVPRLIEPAEGFGDRVVLVNRPAEHRLRREQTAKLVVNLGLALLFLKEGGCLLVGK